MTDDPRADRPTGGDSDAQERMEKARRMAAGMGQAWQGMVSASGAADPFAKESVVRRYRVPCPHCGNGHEVELPDDDVGETFRVECLSCGEPFAWLATESALIGSVGEPGSPESAGAAGDARSGFGLTKDPVVAAGWAAGLGLGVGLVLGTPAELVPEWAGPWITTLLGYGDLFEVVPLAILLIMLGGVFWIIALLLSLLHRRLVRPLRALRGVAIGALAGYAVSLPFFIWRTDRWLATVETGGAWGVGAVALGAATLLLGILLRARTARAARWIAATGVGVAVVGASGVWVESATFGADDPPRMVQSHLAGMQLDEARTAAATASTEADRERADELFSEAGITASRSGDLDRLEEALDAYIEFEEGAR